MNLQELAEAIAPFLPGTSVTPFKWDTTSYIEDPRGFYYSIRFKQYDSSMITVSVGYKDNDHLPYDYLRLSANVSLKKPPERIAKEILSRLTPDAILIAIATAEKKAEFDQRMVDQKVNVSKIMSAGAGFVITPDRSGGSPTDVSLPYSENMGGYGDFYVTHSTTEIRLNSVDIELAVMIAEAVGRYRHGKRQLPTQ